MRELPPLIRAFIRLPSSAITVRDLIAYFLGGTILFSAIVAFQKHYPKPNDELISGVYFNSCCSYLEIHHGLISYRGSSVSYNLNYDKNGLLTASIRKTQIDPEGMRSTPDDGALFFRRANGAEQFNTMIKGKNLVFRRLAPALIIASHTSG